MDIGDVVFCLVQPSSQYYAHIIISKEICLRRRETKYWIAGIKKHCIGHVYKEDIFGVLVRVQVQYGGRYYTRPQSSSRGSVVVIVMAYVCIADRLGKGPSSAETAPCSMSNRRATRSACIDVDLVIPCTLFFPLSNNMLLNSLLGDIAQRCTSPSAVAEALPVAARSEAFSS